MRTIISIVAIILIATATAGLIVFFTLTGRTAELSAAESSVVINEAMSANKGVCLDDKGKSSDWVELYNPSDEDVNLSRFSLSDVAYDPDLWTFPDITLKAHGYIVVFLSGKSKKDTDSLHASFKLNAKGDKLILSAAGTVINTVVLPPMADNVSYARTGDQWLLSDSPTPGEANHTA
jgi:hypothetical protein